MICNMTLGLLSEQRGHLHRSVRVAAFDRCGSLTRNPIEVRYGI